MPTYTRKTHLNQSTFSLLGADYHKTFRNVSIEARDVVADGRSVAERYSDAVTTKSYLKFGGSVMRTYAGLRQSMLSLSLFTFGANDLIARAVSGSMQGTTVLDEGSAGYDQYQYPISQGTEISLKANLLIVNTAAMMDLMKGPIANKRLDLALTMGGFSTVLPVNLIGSNHGYDPTKLQMEDVDFGLAGQVNLGLTSGDTILTSAIVGSAAGAFSFDTGAGIYSAVDGCVVTDFGFNFADGQIIEDNFNFQACGIWTKS